MIINNKKKLFDLIKDLENKTILILALALWNDFLVIVCFLVVLYFVLSTFLWGLYRFCAIFVCKVHLVWNISLFCLIQILTYFFRALYKIKEFFLISEFQKWIDAINEHIRYAEQLHMQAQTTESQNLVPVESLQATLKVSLLKLLYFFCLLNFLIKKRVLNMNRKQKFILFFFVH